jgi:hypothetical protein
MRRAVWLFVLGVLVPCAVAAQETRGNISGTVRDSQGVIPGAAVAITNVDTKVSQNLVTNDSGYFEAPLLNPGIYLVTVQVAGFKTATRGDIVLGVGQQLNIPFTLEIGAISEEIVPCSTPTPFPRARTSTAASSTRCRCSRTCRSR